MDRIPVELIKAGLWDLWKKVHELIQMVWIEETMAGDWDIAILHIVYKKGDRLACKNYRGIALLSTMCKVLSGILASRQQEYHDQIIGDYQSGFRKSVTIDQIFSLRQILEKAYEQKIEIHQLYIGFKQAYNSMNGAAIVQILYEFGEPYKLVRLIQMTLTTTSNVIKLQGKTSGQFDSQR